MEPNGVEELVETGKDENEVDETPNSQAEKRTEKAEKDGGIQDMSIEEFEERGPKKTETQGDKTIKGNDLSDMIVTGSTPEAMESGSHSPVEVDHKEEAGIGEEAESLLIDVFGGWYAV